MRVRKLLVLAAVLGAACDESGGGTGATPQPVDRVQVTAPASTIEAGATMQLAATPLSSDGTVLQGRRLAWESSDAAVAQVSATGSVTGMSAGTVTISALSEGKRGQTVLTVAPPPVLWIEITPAGNLTPAPGTSMALGVVGHGPGGVVLPTGAAAWSSSNDSVASVSAAGVLEARRPGSATITATVDGKTAQRQVTVPTLIARIEVQPGTLLMGVGDVRGVAASAWTATGAPLERAFTWTTSNSAVVSVTSEGRVQAHGTGTATITASSEGRSAAIQVRVGTWTTRPLLAVGDSALPATAFTRTLTDAQGVAHRIRVTATAGWLRTLSSSDHFEILIGGWLIPESGPGEQASYGTTGSLMYDVWNGEPIFDAGNGTSFRGHLRPDGRMQVDWRPAPGEPEVPLVFEW